MLEIEPEYKKPKVLKKITKQRLKNIGLYYLKRFESSVSNLSNVLKRKVNDYSYHNPDFDKAESLIWIEEVIADFERLGYINDNRYAEIKIKSYLNAGKSANYIKQKLQEKGIASSVISEIIENQEYNPYDNALRLAKKKKIGPFREDEDIRKEKRNKDMAILVRAGFDFDTVQKVFGTYFDDEYE